MIGGLYHRIEHLTGRMDEVDQKETHLGILICILEFRFEFNCLCRRFVPICFGVGTTRQQSVWQGLS